MTDTEIACRAEEYVEANLQIRASAAGTPEFKAAVANALEAYHRLLACFNHDPPPRLAFVTVDIGS